MIYMMCVDKIGHDIVRIGVGKPRDNEASGVMIATQ